MTCQQERNNICPQSDWLTLFQLGHTHAYAYARQTCSSLCPGVLLCWTVPCYRFQAQIGKTALVQFLRHEYHGTRHHGTCETSLGTGDIIDMGGIMNIGISWTWGVSRIWGYAGTMEHMPLLLPIVIGGNTVLHAHAYCTVDCMRMHTAQQSLGTCRTSARCMRQPALR